MAAVYTSSVQRELPLLISPSNTEKASLAAFISLISVGSLGVSRSGVPGLKYGMSPQSPNVYFGVLRPSFPEGSAVATVLGANKQIAARTSTCIRRALSFTRRLEIQIPERFIHVPPISRVSFWGAARGNAVLLL